ncbi:MAG TPA: hypothetical protein VE263_03745 [Candidatus Angelobacter sp.]|nr:hypothetical protein [Candidatus Angelobacter sp.]
MGANGCKPFAVARDLPLQNLESRGKTARRILQARDRVLEILQSGNACTQWYRTKDDDPAATFRTLEFEVDRKGDEFVFESNEFGSLTTFRNPYVARVIQGNGAYAMITLNANGAFFSTMGTLVHQAKDGGPVTHVGARMLQVGPYPGNTLQAQVLTLLHEFGHLLDLLPVDEGDRNGQSVQNSMEVLRYCRPEIETKVRGNTLLTSR